MTEKLPIQERLRQQADNMMFPDALEPHTMREAAETIGELVEAVSDARLFVDLVRLRAIRNGDAEQMAEAADSLALIDAILAKAQS